MNNTQTIKIILTANPIKLFWAGMGFGAALSFSMSVCNKLIGKSEKKEEESNK